MTETQGAHGTPTVSERISAVGTAALLAELTTHAQTGSSEPTRALDFGAAEAYGIVRGEAGVSCADMLRDLFTLVDEGVEKLCERHAPPEMVARFARLGHEAARRATAAWERQRQDRRERWLSYLVHDLKNPLNTVLNAVWLLRSRLGNASDLERLLAMVERAGRRIEVLLVEVRALERRSVEGLPRGGEPIPR
jgi:signal transduction histidine kinase